MAFLEIRYNFLISGSMVFKLFDLSAECSHSLQQPPLLSLTWHFLQPVLYCRRSKCIAQGVVAINLSLELNTGQRKSKAHLKSTTLNSPHGLLHTWVLTAAALLPVGLTFLHFLLLISWMWRLNYTLDLLFSFLMLSSMWSSTTLKSSKGVILCRPLPRLNSHTPRGCLLVPPGQPALGLHCALLPCAFLPSYRNHPGLTSHLSPCAKLTPLPFNYPVLVFIFEHRNILLNSYGALFSASWKSNHVIDFMI